MKLRPTSPDYWATVPGGTFSLGLQEDESRALVLANSGSGLSPERLRDEVPSHQQHVAGFLLAVVPLSNLAYQEFIQAGGYRELSLFRELTRDVGPKVEQVIARFVDASGQPGPATWSEGRFPQDAELHPVEGISFYEAAACARYFEARLPSEVEWEYAARYPDGRHFPWGNEIETKEIANFRWNKIGTTSQLGAFPAGVSALGLLDLAGNVHEWTSSSYQAYPGGKVRYRFAGDDSARVARGGAHNGELWDLRCTSRFGVDALMRFPGLGLRLARSV